MYIQRILDKNIMVKLNDNLIKFQDMKTIILVT